MKKMYTTLCLMFALSICKTSIICAQEYIKDSLALVDLYNSTDGPHWKNNTNWLSKSPITDWFGVDVEHRKVIQINMGNNNLNGTIPESIGNLKYLRVLYLNSNQLSGNIPRQIGNLINIVTIHLENNRLSGSLPKSLGKLENLNSINLSNNNLSGSIPKTIGKLNNLVNLYLKNNNLSGRIPESLDTLPQLYGLYLSHNSLSGRIPSFKKFIGELDLSYNRLRGNIPKSLGKVEVYFLYLNNNKLSGNIPLTLPYGLNILDLSKNKFTGTIPDTIGKSGLRSLTLSHNKLHGTIPTTFSQLSDLHKLDIRDNQLTDTVPAFLASLPALNILYIQFNHFTFNGIEQLAQHNFSDFRYGFERKIKVNQNNSILSVYAGGTLSNNTYKWYNNGVLAATINGDSTFMPTASGNYSVEVTNSIATALTLKSDTVSFNISSAIAQNNIDAVKANDKINFSVYPNPVKTLVTIEFSATGNYNLRLSDNNGKILQTKKGVAANNKNNIHLDVSRYTAGVYFITITDEKNRIQSLKLNKE